MWITTGIFLVAVISFGLLFLRLHTLPERMAHRTHHLQFETVAVLGLLALVDIPDFLGPVRRIAGSSERIAASKREG
jgi:hypothetical protein